MRFILLTLAIMMLLAGLLSMVTPMPGGTLLIAVGCALLICTSKRAARWIKVIRTNKVWVNKPMTWMENKMGVRLSGPMRLTRPDAMPFNETDHD